MTLFDDPESLPGRTLWQPYAGLVELGLKDLEAVTVRTRYRGRLVICAGLRVDEAALQRARRRLVPQVVSAEAFDQATRPRGVAVALVELVGVRRLERRDEPRVFWWDPGEPRWAWQLAALQRLEPFPVRGMPGFFPISRASVQRAQSP